MEEMITLNYSYPQKKNCVEFKITIDKRQKAKPVRWLNKSHCYVDALIKNESTMKWLRKNRNKT